MKNANAKQLKDWVKNEAKKKNISAQLVLQNYMLERLVARISLSSYKNNLIIKGGFLISIIAGLDTRATMDLDTTVKGLDLTKEKILEIFSEICKLEADDNIIFSLQNIEDIRKTDDYPGLRLSLKANYPPISVPLSIDITTGDIITPEAIEFEFVSLFGNEKYDIMAYNFETILAEKLETILSRSIANTRPRDFYDVYIISKLYNSFIKRDVLLKALKNTAHKRCSEYILNEYSTIIEAIKQSSELENFWVRYGNNFSYVKDISYAEVCNSVENLLQDIFSSGYNL